MLRTFTKVNLNSFGVGHSDYSDTKMSMANSHYFMVDWVGKEQNLTWNEESAGVDFDCLNSNYSNYRVAMNADSD